MFSPFCVTCMNMISWLTNWYWITNRDSLLRKTISPILSIHWLQIVLWLRSEPCAISPFSMGACLLILYFSRPCVSSHIVEVSWMKLPARAGYHTITYSLHLYWLWFAIMVSFFCKEKFFLIRDENYPHLWVCLVTWQL